MGKWPKSGEDKQVDDYWREHAEGGGLYTEVCLGRTYWDAKDWEGRARQRRFDGVLALGAERGERPGRHKAFHRRVLAGEINRVELIEAKKGLGEALLGQALTGRYMFDKQIGERHGITVERDIVLYRHCDPAMLWVANKLGLKLVRSSEPKNNRRMQNRAKYKLRTGRLGRLAAFQEQNPGSILSRVPLAGPDSGVDGWKGAVETFIPFVRVAGHEGAGIRLVTPRDETFLRERDDLELLLVTAGGVGRGALGIIASHALMFQEQYGRPFSACRIVCRAADPATSEACRTFGGSFGVPTIEVHEMGGGSNVEEVEETDEEGDEDMGDAEVG